MARKFGELRSPQVADAVKANALLLFPVGQTEEHGPHLPLNTDTLIAQALCEAAADRLEGEIRTYVLDPLSYGFSAQVMERWPGTFRLSLETVIAAVREVCESLARMGFGKIVIVSGHGHHTGAMQVVSRQVADRCGVDVAVVLPAGMAARKLAEIAKAGPGGSCHAGEYETSLMLYLFPHLVEMRLTSDVDTLHLTGDFSSSEVFWSTWMRQRSKTGVYGNPTVACADTGRQLFDAHVERLVQFLRTYYAHALPPEA